MLKISVDGNADQKVKVLNDSSVELNDEILEMEWIKLGDKRFHVLIDNRSVEIEIISINRSDKQMVLALNGKEFHLNIKDRYDDLLERLGMNISNGVAHLEVKAPMPGMVLDVMVSEGDEIEKDTPLVILEAMKMENVIKSISEGKIKKVVAKKGSAVEKNAVLIEFHD